MRLFSALCSSASKRRQLPHDLLTCRTRAGVSLVVDVNSCDVYLSSGLFVFGLAVVLTCAAAFFLCSQAEAELLRRCFLILVTFFLLILTLFTFRTIIVYHWDLPLFAPFMYASRISLLIHSRSTMSLKYSLSRLQLCTFFTNL